MTGLRRERLRGVPLGVLEKICDCFECTYVKVLAELRQ